MPREYTSTSGFGGQYERCCRAMVLAGCDWLDAHPDAEPEFKRFKNVYGICLEENADAKRLNKAMLAVSEPLGGATGAMHQACINHVLAIKRMGWEKYVEEMSKPDKDAPVEKAS